MTLTQTCRKCSTPCRFVKCSLLRLLFLLLIFSFQSAEAARQDGQPRWMQLVCLIHDLGKRLALPPLNEPQHLTVGDTFPVGCAFSPKIVHSKFFALNPDYNNPAYSTKFGVYAAGCGLHNIHMSWGHDEVSGLSAKYTHILLNKFDLCSISIMLSRIFFLLRPHLSLGSIRFILATLKISISIS